MNDDKGFLDKIVAEENFNLQNEKVKIERNELLFIDFLFIRRRYYVPLGTRYYKCEILTSLLMILTIAVLFLVTYKPGVTDPAEGEKSAVMVTYLVFILALVILNTIIGSISEDKKTLGKRLITIFAVSMIGMITFFGIKLNLDSKYTSQKFEQIYVQEKNNVNSKEMIKIGLTGVERKTEKQFYVDECMAAYNVFNARFYILLSINILFEMLLIYQMIKVFKIQEKYEQLKKDDEVLFDEEENIKF